jgi:hypothetical protein
MHNDKDHLRRQRAIPSRPQTFSASSEPSGSVMSFYHLVRGSGEAKTKPFFIQLSIAYSLKPSTGLEPHTE